MKVVVVESPAKAKTINAYLGKDYHVLASYGHVRDLPPKDGSVRPDEDFAMSWQLDERGEKRLSDIAKALKNADALVLATDPDREGEAISWHVREALDQRNAINGKPVSRVVFHEITKRAVLDAIAHPRDINGELVDAYLARRALDYLVGFRLSPVLWRKLPGARSAGRVQSVALRLISEREAEIERFVKTEYWSIEAAFTAEGDRTFKGKLTHLDGEKLDRLAIGNEGAATAIVERLSGRSYSIDSVEQRQVKRNPPPPFTTSTLQQEASRKLRLSTQQTMRLAQKLYEGIELDGETVGLITYMRTDSVALSEDALTSCRSVIGKEFGGDYLHDGPRRYKSKAKNAQEAHEAIRPTDPARLPAAMRRRLDGDMARLYELVWKRTLASQMASARVDQVAVDVVDGAREATFHATGSVIAFDGFLKLYIEDRDDADDDDEDGRRLPRLSEGEATAIGEVVPDQHFTQPPPRFTEASLVKRLEELGIGRPSTYASIIQVLQDRDYVRLESRRFVPEDRGRLVTAFLHKFFDRYVDYDFTADLENQLDEVSNGDLNWQALLRRFWEAFAVAVEGAQSLSITEVIDHLNDELAPHFFPDRGDGKDPRACPACAAGQLGLRLGKHGAFVGCSNYPDCSFTRPLARPGEGDDDAADLPRDLGEHPRTGVPVSVRKGPYGIYVQGGTGEGGEKPARVSLPKGMDPMGLDLDTAAALLDLPRELGRHNETGKPILAGIGRYGPYILHDGGYRSLAADDDVLTIGLNRAHDIIAQQPKGGRGGGAGLLKEMGDHPSGGAVTLHKGRFGPYVKHGKTMASLTKGMEVDTLDLEAAVALVDAKAAKGGKKPAAKKAAPKKAAPKKAAAGKTPAKKTAPKKAASKKTATKTTAAEKPATKKTAAKKTTAKKPAAKPAARAD